MTDYVNPAIGDTLLIAFIGFLTVFVVLIVLMFIIALISKAAGGSTPSGAPAPAAPAAPAPASVPAADVYTGVRLNGVDDKTAATLMAIVADETGISLDELRFISIKEVK